MADTVSVTDGDAMLFADEAFRNMDIDLSLDDVEAITGALQTTFNRLLARLASAQPAPACPHNCGRCREAERMRA